MKAVILRHAERQPNRAILSGDSCCIGTRRKYIKGEILEVRELREAAVGRRTQGARQLLRTQFVTCFLWLVNYSC